MAKTDPTPEPEAPAAPAPSPTDLVVDGWFTDLFFNRGPFISADLFNYLNHARQDLKDRLAAMNKEA